MAQVVRTAPVVAASNASGTRISAGVRSAANADRSAVDGISTKNGTFLGDAGFQYQGYTKDGLQGGAGFDGTGGRGRRSALPTLGPMRTTSQAFAAFLEFEGDPNRASRGTLTGGAAVSGALISRATAIYEANSRIIHEAPSPVGVSLNMML